MRRPSVSDATVLLPVLAPVTGGRFDGPMVEIVVGAAGGLVVTGCWGLDVGLDSEMAGPSTVRRTTYQLSNVTITPSRSVTVVSRPVGVWRGGTTTVPPSSTTRVAAVSTLGCAR